MTQGTPKMKTHIKKDRYGMFATVTLTQPDGRKAETSMRPDIKAGDLEVVNFKRQLAHMKPLKVAA
jgi:hypothetical protein